MCGSRFKPGDTCRIQAIRYVEVIDHCRVQERQVRDLVTDDQGPP